MPKESSCWAAKSILFYSKFNFQKLSRSKECSYRHLSFDEISKYIHVLYPIVLLCSVLSRLRFRKGSLYFRRTEVRLFSIAKDINYDYVESWENTQFKHGYSRTIELIKWTVTSLFGIVYIHQLHPTKGIHWTWIHKNLYLVFLRINQLTSKQYGQYWWSFIGAAQHFPGANHSSKMLWRHICIDYKAYLFFILDSWR